MSAPSTVEPRRVRAWDMPTRLFHWLLLALILSAYGTRFFSRDPTLYWHRINGYAILTLLIFRFLWGFVGSSTSRFIRFVPTPSAVVRYANGLVRGRSPRYLGHNPLGTLIICAMLLAVLAQAYAGLFTSDDALAQGPLNEHVSDWFAGRMGFYHSKGFWIILGLAAVHVLANLFYQFFKKDRLITAMVTGRKPALDYVDQPQASIAPLWRAGLCLAAALAIVVGGVFAAGDTIFR